jgi:hypothetical protein
MGTPWDSIGPDMQEVVNEIVRTAVVYGYLRGLDRAFATAVQPGGASSPLWIRTNDLRTRLARKVAEEFLTKIYVEQATQPSGPDEY